MDFIYNHMADSSNSSFQLPQENPLGRNQKRLIIQGIKKSENYLLTKLIFYCNYGYRQPFFFPNNWSHTEHCFMIIWTGVLWFTQKAWKLSGLILTHRQCRKGHWRAVWAGQTRSVRCIRSSSRDPHPSRTPHVQPLTLRWFSEASPITLETKLFWVNHYRQCIQR